MSMGRHDRSMGRHDRSVGRHKRSVGRHDRSMGRHERFMGRHDRFLGKYDSSMGRHAHSLRQIYLPHNIISSTKHCGTLHSESIARSKTVAFYSKISRYIQGSAHIFARFSSLKHILFASKMKLPYVFLETVKNQDKGMYFSHSSKPIFMLLYL